MVHLRQVNMSGEGDGGGVRTHCTFFARVDQHMLCANLGHERFVFNSDRWKNTDLLESARAIEPFVTQLATFWPVYRQRVFLWPLSGE